MKKLALILLPLSIGALNAMEVGEKKEPKKSKFTLDLNKMKEVLPHDVLKYILSFCSCPLDSALNQYILRAHFNKFIEDYNHPSLHNWPTLYEIEEAENISCTNCTNWPRLELGEMGQRVIFLKNMNEKEYNYFKYLDQRLTFMQKLLLNDIWLSMKEKRKYSLDKHNTKRFNAFPEHIKHIFKPFVTPDFKTKVSVLKKAIAKKLKK